VACSPRSSCFLTGTFPGGSASAQASIASQAPWIINTLKAWLYKRIGKNVGYYVWEFQKRGTLHLHYVVVIDDEALRASVIADFRDEWIRLIAGASARSGENLFIGNHGRNFFTEQEKLQIYAQECYKDCASYLSKYLAKKSQSDFPAPCRLWGATKEARNLVAKGLISFSVIGKSLPVADALAHRLDSYSDGQPEKRRYFRHRFSQGFTILLYDEGIRRALEELSNVPTPEYHMQQRVFSLYGSLQKLDILGYLKQTASPPMLPDLSLIISSNWKAISVEEWSAFFISSIELKSLILLCPFLTRYQKNELRNRLNIIQSELTDIASLSHLRKADASIAPDREAEGCQTGMDELLPVTGNLQLSIE